MDTYRYLIIGGGVAGGKAVEGIRSVDATGTIALVTQEPHRPYHRPSLSKSYLIGKKPESEVYVASADYYPEHNVTLLTGVRAEGIDRDAQTVTLNDGRVVKYESLLLATGGRARRLRLPGSELDHVLTLRTIENSDRIRELAGPGKRALVLGGSFIGSEVAAGLAMLGVDVTMAFPESRLLERIVPREMSEWLHAIYAAHTIKILAGTTPQRLLGDAGVERVELSNGATPPVDLVVMGVGIELNTELAREAGLKTREPDRAVLVDDHLRTVDPHIYAAGDIAAWKDVNFGKRLRVEHWDVARGQGLLAGRNMAGADERYEDLPYFFSDLFDLSFEVWGDLDTCDQVVRRGDLEARNIAYYYFNEGRLVGVLAMGRPDEEREPMQALVRARPQHRDVAKHLQDATSDLSALA